MKSAELSAALARARLDIDDELRESRRRRADRPTRRVLKARGARPADAPRYVGAALRGGARSTATTAQPPAGEYVDVKPSERRRRAAARRAGAKSTAAAREVLRRYDEYPQPPTTGSLRRCDLRAASKRRSKVPHGVRLRGVRPNASGALNVRELRDALAHMGVDGRDAARGASSLRTRPDGKLDLDEFHDLTKDLSRRGTRSRRWWTTCAAGDAAERRRRRRRQGARTASGEPSLKPSRERIMGGIPIIITFVASSRPTCASCGPVGAGAHGRRGVSERGAQAVLRRAARHAARRQSGECHGHLDEFHDLTKDLLKAHRRVTRSTGSQLGLSTPARPRRTPRIDLQPPLTVGAARRRRGRTFASRRRRRRAREQWRRQDGWGRARVTHRVFSGMK